ncbi:MAG: glutathione S-transferase [Pseudomonadota bacterium]
MSYTLHIGNKRYSSWSLRGWLLLDAFGVPFEERLTPMFTAAFEALKTEMAPGRQVPTLAWTREDGARQIVWDSLAIAELLADRHPEAGHWPADPAQRALARCLAAEMHSGLAALRREMPMNIGAAFPGRGHSEASLADVARVETLWAHARALFPSGGPYLFGSAFTAADAFFAPVAYRFETYAPPLSPAAGAYAEALRAHPACQRWRAAAEAEPWREPRYFFEAP